MKENVTKRTIFGSIFVLILCVSLMVGGTFAWFTANVSVKDNKITSGTLQAELYKYTSATGTPTVINSNTAADWTKITETTPADFIFGNDFKNWKPGDVKTVCLAVKNNAENSSLDLKYNLDLVILQDTMSDALLFSVASNKTTTPAPVPAITTVSSQIVKGVIAAAPNGALSVGETEYITLSMKMSESAGNSYQGGLFSMELVLNAMQVNANLVKAYTVADINSAPENSTVALLKDINEPESIVDIKDKFINIDLAGKTLTVKNFSIKSDARVGTIDIANGKIIANGVAPEFGNITVSAALGTVNIINVNGTISQTGKVFFKGSKSTVNLVGSTQFSTPDQTSATVVVGNGSRIVLDTPKRVLVAPEIGADDITFEESAIYAHETPSPFIVLNGVITGLTEEGKRLETLIVPSKIKGVTITEIGDLAFSRHYNLVPDIKGNPETAFGDTKNAANKANREVLKSVICSSSIEKIGACAFWYNQALNAITLPAELKEIGRYAFCGVSSKGVTPELPTLTALTLPNELEIINDHAFMGCKDLTAITFPASVTTIGNGTFNYCMALTTAVVPANVTNFGKGIFSNCTSLTSATLNNSPTEIGDNMFQNTPIKTFVIPASVTKIGNFAFERCAQLTSIDMIGAQITEVGESAFNKCSNLASITLPDTLTTLSTAVFWSLLSLKTIYIPQSVTIIDSQIFRNCTGLVISCWAKANEVPAGWVTVAGSEWNRSGNGGATFTTNYGVDRNGSVRP